MTTHWVRCSHCLGEREVPDYDAGRVVGNEWITRETVACPFCMGKGEVAVDTAQAELVLEQQREVDPTVGGLDD